MKRTDLVGRLFGRLVVLNREHDVKMPKTSAWRCVCNCGKETIVGRQSLVSGATKSCGCLALELLSARARDITGQRFGRLVAIQKASSTTKKSRWQCVCDCGNTTIVDYQQIKDLKTVSCGCHKKEVAARNGKTSRSKISGVNSYLYKTELTEEDRTGRRNTFEIREWRKAVYERDLYTCDLCQTQGGRLCAHHLNGWADFKEQRFDIDNGITLCQKHHHEFHQFMGGARKSCRVIDYARFKAVEYLRFWITSLEREQD